MRLEIKVMWCKGLTAFNFFQKLTLYAAVSITSEDQRIILTQEQKQEQKTPIDDEGEGNPEWNYSMKFDLGSLISLNSNFEGFSLLFELRHPGQFFGDKIIGEVRVPLKDLIDSVGNELVRFVSYEVRNSDGKHNGVLDFSYKVIGNFVDSSDCQIHIGGYEDQNQTNPDHDHGGSNQWLSSDPEKIQYPKIDLEEWGSNSMPSAPPLVRGDENVQTQFYPPPPSSSLSSAATATAYPPPHGLYPPQWPQSWAPPPGYPPPPLPPQPYVYPPPPSGQLPPYGDPNWGYERPPEYHWW